MDSKILIHQVTNGYYWYCSPYIIDNKELSQFSGSYCNFTLNHSEWRIQSAAIGCKELNKTTSHRPMTGICNVKRFKPFCLIKS